VDSFFRMEIRWKLTTYSLNTLVEEKN